MATSKKAAPKKGVPCCPAIESDKNCNILDFNYRLTHPKTVNNSRVLVEVILHVRLEICRGPLTLGNLAYSTTLLPGEKVRLFTLDRRNRFSFDSETNLSYRHEQTHEEQYYMASMSEFMSDLTVTDRGSARASSSSNFSTSGSTSGAIESFLFGASVGVKGSFDSQSTSEFGRELRRHAESSHNRSVQATRASSSVSVGEVNRRTHAEGESESHFESSSRVFSNPNRCHAITYYFYQINQQQTIKYSIVSIKRRVVDRAADTIVTNKPLSNTGAVSVLPTAILATNTKRLAVEEQARASVLANKQGILQTSNFSPASTFLLQSSFVGGEPINQDVRAAALEAVDNDLIANGLIDRRTKELSQNYKRELSFEITTSLPTPGLLVKGCLDDCDVCEDSLMKEIEIDLERKKLENDLLRKQIELLEKSQEYRCCPEGEEETEDDS